MTPSGIEPANFRLRALYLNQMRHRVSHFPALSCWIPTPVVSMYHLRRRAGPSLVLKCGKTREYTGRLWDPIRLLSNKYRVKQTELESTFHLRLCSTKGMNVCNYIAFQSHLFLTQCTINTGQFYTYSPSVWHRGHCSYALHVLSTLKRAQKLYLSLIGNHYFNWKLLVSTACRVVYSMWPNEASGFIPAGSDERHWLGKMCCPCFKNIIASTKGMV